MLGQEGIHLGEGGIAHGIDVAQDFVGGIWHDEHFSFAQTGSGAQTTNSPPATPSNNSAVGSKASLTGLAAIFAAALGVAFA